MDGAAWVIAQVFGIMCGFTLGILGLAATLQVWRAPVSAEVGRALFVGLLCSASLVIGSITDIFRLIAKVAAG